MITTGQKTSVCSCRRGTVLRNTALLSLLICLLTCATGGRLVGHTNNVRDPSHLHLPTIQCSTAPNDDDDARGSKESSATTTTTANHTQVPAATLPKHPRVQYSTAIHKRNTNLRFSGISGQFFSRACMPGRDPVRWCNPRASARGFSKIAKYIYGE